MDETPEPGASSLQMSPKQKPFDPVLAARLRAVQLLDNPVGVPIEIARNMLGVVYGSTTRELTNLIMAAEEAFDKFGKVSFFGRDKGKEAESKFTAALVHAILALERIGAIMNAKDATESFAKLNEAMSHMRKGFSNWPRAYKYWDMFIAGRV